MDNDLYTEILNLPVGERPPHFYDLLLVDLFEDAEQTINQAGLEQVKKLKEWEIHPDSETREFVQQVLNQVSQACIVLKNPERKHLYDLQLSQRLEIDYQPEVSLEEIQSSSSEIATKRAELVADNVCSVCDFKNDNEARFCGNCGAIIRKNCPECEKELSIHIQFCTNCGTDTDGFVQARTALQHGERFAKEKKWEEVIKVCDIVPENLKFPGEKGQKLHENLKRLTQSSHKNLDLILELEQQLNQAISEDNTRQILSIFKRYSELVPIEKIDQNTIQLVNEKDAKARKEYRRKLIKFTVIGMTSSIVFIVLLALYIQIMSAYNRKQQFESYIKEASEFLKNKKWGQAVDSFNLAITVEGYENNKEALDGIRKSESKIKQFEEKFNEGKKYLSEFDWDKAIESLEDALKTDGFEAHQEALNGIRKSKTRIKEYKSAFKKGQNFLSKLDWKDAADAFKRALSVEGYEKDKSATTGLKKAEMKIKKYETAISNAEDFLLDQEWEKAIITYNDALSIPGYTKDSKAIRGIERTKSIRKQTLLKNLVKKIIQQKYADAIKEYDLSFDKKSFPGIRKIIEEVMTAKKCILEQMGGKFLVTLDDETQEFKAKSVNVKTGILYASPVVGGKTLSLTRKFPLATLNLNLSITQMEDYLKKTSLSKTAIAVFLAAECIRTDHTYKARHYMLNTGVFAKPFREYLD
jgi:tetratricopeptide (TPR) repeat protein